MMDLPGLKFYLSMSFSFTLYIAKVSAGEAIVCILIYVYHVLKVL